MDDTAASVRCMVDDAQAAIDFYTTHLGATFRNDIVTGPGGRQIVFEDPAGNPVELFTQAAG